MLFQASAVLVELPGDEAGGSVMFPVVSRSLLIWYAASETINPLAMRMHHSGKPKHLWELLEFKEMCQYDLSNSSV